jgi:DHA2 family multidrug resistance protein
MSNAAIAAPGATIVPRANVNRWAIAVAVSIAALLEIIDTSIVNVALNDMQASLGTTLSEVAWVVSGYGIANVIILPLSAWLGRRFGEKAYFLFSLFGFVAASVLCGFATSLALLVVARVLQGLTGGGLLAKAQAILFETFPKSEQAMAQGLFGAIVVAGPAIGPTLGGYLVTNLSWRWIFFINVPIGAIAVLMIVAFLPADAERAKNEPVDWLAIALLTVGIGALQGLLEEGQQELWFESRFIQVLAVLAAVGLVAFVVRSLRSKTPVVDLRVLRHRSLWSGSIVSAVIGVVLYGSLFAIPIFAGRVLDYTSQQIGMLLLPPALASAVAMPIAAKLMARHDPRVLVAVGAAMLLGSMVMFSSLSPQTAGDLFWPNIVRGFGTVLMFLPLQLAALGSIPKAEVAAASGFFNLTRQLGGSIGVALLTTLLDDRTAFHRAVLVEKLTAGDLETGARVDAMTRGLITRGVPELEAQRKALALLDGSINLQSAVMSFGDMFLATAALLVLTFPLLLLLRKPSSDASVSMGH